VAGWALQCRGEAETSFNGEQGKGSLVPAGARIFLTGALLLLVGASIPLSEWVFPKSTQVCPAGWVCGRAIYPRFYAAGEGEPGTAKMGYGTNKEPRLVFWLVGAEPGLVIYPISQAPASFPHAAEVQILGRREGEVLWAEEIIK